MTAPTELEEAMKRREERLNTDAAKARETAKAQAVEGRGHIGLLILCSDDDGYYVQLVEALRGSKPPEGLVNILVEAPGATYEEACGKIVATLRANESQLARALGFDTDVDTACAVLLGSNKVTCESPNQREWSDPHVRECVGLLLRGVQHEVLNIGRKDRHNRGSEIESIEIDIEGTIDYPRITQLAGMFDTPIIDFEPVTRDTEEEIDVPCIRVTVLWSRPAESSPRFTKKAAPAAEGDEIGGES